MDNIEVTADDLPTAKVDTGYNTVDGKDKQTIFPAKSSCLSGKHTERLLQIRVTGQQRADRGIQAKDRKADGEHIQSLKFTEQERQETGNRTQAHGVDQISLVCHQIACQIGEYTPGAACMPDDSLGNGSTVKIIGI